ncbi:MAG: substrate-binding domain-containing protein [Alphaproteobacteria bacterium]|nr:substrate-binding domain-containing protein [Alphaproteobacteria bacterium]
MTKPSRLISLLFAATLYGLSSVAGATEPRQQTTPAKITFTAAGSGVNLGITKLLAQGFMASHPEIEITIPGSIGTKGAITAIADNAITFGLISRPLKENEASPDYSVVGYALTPIVIGTHPSVKDESISSEDLINIYKGTKTKWSDGKEIIVQSREASDSGFMVIGKIFPEFKTACEESRKAERWITYFTDQEANTALSRTEYAIGVTDLGMIATEKLGIKALKLNDIMPSVETARNGLYPLSRTLFLLYRTKNIPSEAATFIDYIFSQTGAEILKTHGYLPLERKTST